MASLEWTVGRNYEISIDGDPTSPKYVQQPNDEARLGNLDAIRVPDNIRRPAELLANHPDDMR